jgi:hypothetical protein
MLVSSYRIAPVPNREIMPPICLGAALRQTAYAARRVALRERVNLPHRRVAPAQNPKSAFPRIYPMNPEPTVAPAQNPKSTFPRIYPMNPEPTAASAQNPQTTFPRTNPPAPEPAAAPTPTPRSTFLRSNPASPEPRAERFLTRMTAPSRQTYSFTRLPCGSGATVLTT